MIVSDTALNSESNGQKTGLKWLNPEEGHFSLDIHGPDIPDRTYGKLFLPEEYKTALQVAKQYKQISDQQERMLFWDAHPNVFGIASLVVFDTKEEAYWGYHGQSLYTTSNELEGNSGRYEIVGICPFDYEKGLWPFVEWCIQKCQTTETYAIVDQGGYWQQIKQHLMPTVFLTKLLNTADTFYERTIRDLGDLNIVPTICAEALAKKYFFAYGYKDAMRGQATPPKRTLQSLLTVNYNILACPLSVYSEIYFQYYNGRRTAEMIAFLQQQKKRMDSGENIQLPVSDTTHQAKSQNSNGKTKRVNLVAQQNHQCINDKFNKYIKEGYTYEASLQALVHDFRLEYSPKNATNRKKILQSIIRAGIIKNNK